MIAQAINGAALLIAIVLALTILGAVGRHHHRTQTGTSDEPRPEPTPEPVQAPRRTHAHTSYQCNCCDTHFIECVKDPARALQLARDWTCPACTNTLQRLEQEVSS